MEEKGKMKNGKIVKDVGRGKERGIRMENKTYKEMTLGELWQEITVLVNVTHFSDIDKEMFLKLIEEYGFRCKKS